MFGQIEEIKNLAFKYSKEQLGRMAQMGMIDPQKAMMAGMMRDRVSKEDTKPPTTTVAQDVLGAAPQVQQPAQPQQPQMGMPQQAPAPQAPAQMAATGGVTSLPVQEQDYAGGGIVAFADGGDTKREGQYEYVFDPASGTYKEVGAPKEVAIPVDTRQHLGAAGLGVFGSEGMDLMTGLPKGNMRDPVLGFADGGVAHFDSGGFNFPAGSLFGMYERRPTAGGVAMDELQRLDAQIAQTPPGPMRDRMIQTREFAASKAAAANTQQFPSGIIATPEGQQAQQDMGAITNPFNAPADNTPAAAAPAPGANKAPAGAGGGPRLPALKEPTGDIDVKKYNAKPAQELDEITKEQNEAYRKAGIDPDLYKNMIKKEEDKKEGIGKRREEAKGEFLMNLGLGLTQAKRGQEFAALGAGAKEGLASYKESMKDVRLAEEKLEDRVNSFKLADQQAKKTGTDAALAKRDRQKELVEAAESKYVDAQNAAAGKSQEIKAHIFGTKTQAETARYVAGVNAQTQREYTAALKQQGLQDSQIKNIMGTAAEIQKNKINAGNTEFTMEQAIKEAMAAYRQAAPLAGREVPAAGGLRRDANGTMSYVPAT